MNNVMISLVLLVGVIPIMMWYHERLERSLLIQNDKAPKSKFTKIMLAGAIIIIALAAFLGWNISHPKSLPLDSIESIALVNGSTGNQIELTDEETKSGTTIFTEEFWIDVTSVIGYEFDRQYETKEETVLWEIYTILSSLNYQEIELQEGIEGGSIFDLITKKETFNMWVSGNLLGFEGKTYLISEKQIDSTLIDILKENDSLNVNVSEVAAGNYIIDIADEASDLGLPVYMSISLLLDKENQIIPASKSVRCETGTDAEYDSVSVYLNDESENTKYVWVTIRNVKIYSDSGEFLRRMEFEYELTFRFDTETLEVFDMQKNGENVVKM